MPRIFKKKNNEPLALPELARRLKTLREELGESQATMSEKLEIATSALHNFENGIRPIRVDVVKNLHSIYGMNLNWFFDGTGDPTIMVKKRSKRSDIDDLIISNKVLELKVKQMEKEITRVSRELFALRHG